MCPSLSWPQLPPLLLTLHTPSNLLQCDSVTWHEEADCRPFAATPSCNEYRTGWVVHTAIASYDTSISTGRHASRDAPWRLSLPVFVPTADPRQAQLGPLPRKGMCSNYLSRTVVGTDAIRLSVRTSSFRLPKDLGAAPIIMVGPGTGISPMLGFLQVNTLNQHNAAQSDVQMHLTSAWTVLRHTHPRCWA